jgi:hypothetical protein
MGEQEYHADDRGREQIEEEPAGQDGPVNRKNGRPDQVALRQIPPRDRHRCPALLKQRVELGFGQGSAK